MSVEKLYDRLTTSVPVNRQAMIVTLGGANPSENDTSVEVQIENLQMAIRQVQEQIVSLPKGTAGRKALGARQHALETELRELRGFRPAKSKDFNTIWLDVAREGLSKHTFDAITKEATSRSSGDYPNATQNL